MIVTVVVSVAIVIAVSAAATRIVSARVWRRRKLIEEFTVAVSERRVATLPVRRSRVMVAGMRRRKLPVAADVEVLADYREARAERLRHPHVGAGLPRRPRPRRPESA